MQTREEMVAKRAGSGRPVPPANGQDGTAVVRVVPSKGWRSVNLREVWAYRELLYFLVWRDVNVRYKQTFLGIAWAIIQPVSAMVLFSLFFGRLAKMPSDGIPYPIFSYAALVPWTFFSGGLGAASNSIVGNTGLVTKVYFPRLVIPLASVLGGLVDFALAFIVLLGMMVAYGIMPTAKLFWLPFLLLLALGTALGVGLWLAALNVYFRDVRYILPYITQIWLFATPVAYPSSLLPDRWRVVYGLNPMAGVIEGFRWALLGTNTRPGATLIVSAVTVALILVTGVFYFKRMENTFADLV